jgi:hypothetical protein
MLLGKKLLYSKHTDKHFIKGNLFRPYNPGSYILWYSHFIDENTETLVGSKAHTLGRDHVVPGSMLPFS